MGLCESVTPASSTDPVWSEWRQLMSRTPRHQQLFGPDWFRIWLNSWGAAGQWTGRSSIITVRDDNGTLQGLLALGRPTVGPITRYAIGGHSVPHRGIVAAAGEEVEVGRSIGQFLADRQWPALQIGPILNDSAADQAMISQLQQSGVFLQHRDSREEITLHAPDTWDEYCREKLGSKFVRKVNYYERRMQRDGYTTMKHYRQPSADETDIMFDALRDIEAASWMATRDDAVPRFTDPGLRNFWKQQTVEHLSPRDHLDCWVQSLDDHPVSFCFTLTDGSVRYVIANNYDNAVKSYRTGSIIYQHMIREGIERGVRRFEFADGNLHYKSLWGARVDGSRETWLAVPNRLLGRAAAVATRVRSWMPQRKRPSDAAKAPRTSVKEQETAGTQAVLSADGASRGS